MKAFSTIFAILAVMAAAAFIMGNDGHWVTFSLCLGLAFVAWPDNDNDGGMRYGRG